MDLKIDDSLVKKLIAQQFPHLSDLPVNAIKKQGWDNRTFRLGDELAVRLPSDPSYAAAVHKETNALAILSSRLSVAIPKIFALGEPDEHYALPWSIRRWIEGDTLEDAKLVDRRTLATNLGATLVELRSAPVDIELYAGKHSFFRGCHPSVYGDEVVKSLNILNGQIDTKQCLDIWQNAMTSAWTAKPVWFHGDFAVGNILMRGQTMSALIDFGTCGIGDPACDFAIAWTYFDVDQRQHFKKAVKIDDGTWQRAKAWALWKALASLAGLSSPDINGIQARALNEIVIEGP
jgi:aminoglycoside phosphotransferase (APT) family kinase protein